jgi:PAS domain S-box-containing protein
VLFSNQPALPANQLILEGLEAELRAGPADPEQVFYEYLDAVRFDRPEVQEATAVYFRIKYGKSPPNIVLAVGPQALIFINERRSMLFPQAAIAFAGVREERLPLGLPPRTPGILSEWNPVKSLELGLTLQPDTRHVFVVTGASAFDKGWEKTAREKFAPFAAKREVAYLAGLPLEELIERVGHLPPHSIIVYLSLFEDGRGQQYLPRDIAGRIATAANAPIYAVYDTYIGTGIVGGYMDTFKAVGRQLGVLANRLLKGEDPGSISPYEAETHRYIVDWRQLDRWSFAESALPAGTELRFKPASMWELYKTEILLTLALILLQSALLVKSFLEIKRRKRAEANAKQSEERMDVAVSGANLGLWNWSVQDDAIWATEHCRQMLGLPSNEPLTRESFLQHFSAEERSAAGKRMSAAMESGESSEIEYEVTRPDGSRRWVFSMAMPKGERGKPDHLLGVVLDITDRKQAEAEAEHQRRELAHLTRVSILGALSGALAHELKQPLTAILSNAQAAQGLLKRGPPDVEELRDILGDIVADNRRAGAVIEHLRALLKKDEKEAEPLDINELVSATLQLCRSDLLLRNVAIVKEIDDGIPPVKGDRVQLGQVILNLITNGCEAMGDQPVSSRVLVVRTARHRGDFVSVSVTDHGVGIPVEMQGRVFDPFYSTKPLGLGLGLSICDWIVAAHGGKLSAENNPKGGGGATFRFELPIASVGSEAWTSSRSSSSLTTTLPS